MRGIKKTRVHAGLVEQLRRHYLAFLPQRVEAAPLTRARQLAAAGGGRVKTQPKAADKRQQPDPARRRSLSEHGVGVPKPPQSLHFAHLYGTRARRHR